MDFNEDLLKISIELRFTEKRLDRSAKKLEQEAKKKKSLLAQSLNQGNREKAQIYAEAIKRIEQEIKTTQILAARVSGMRIRLDQVKVTQQVSGVLAGLTEQLQKDETLQFSHVESIMDRFETATQNLEVMEGVMNHKLSQVTTLPVEEDDIDDLIAEIADENDLELHALLPSVPSKPAQKATNRPIAAPSEPQKKSLAS